MAKETIRRYTLKTEKEGWLGEVILTDKKELYSLTDWGNFNFSWSTPMEIREFILSIDVDYFGRKMYQGVAYQCSNEEGVVKDLRLRYCLLSKKLLNKK